MANRLGDITSWYNNDAAYPDLILELHDGRSIRVHKAILNQTNKYYESICYNAGIPFKDRVSVGRINLALLSPDCNAAVLAVVRIIYGFPLPAVVDLTWPVWFDLAVHVQRYFEPEVGRQAVENFKMSALQQTDSNEVIKIMGKLEGYSGMIHDDLVDTIRKHHAVKLLRNEVYREALMLSDPDTLVPLIDDGLGMVEKNSMAS